MIPEIDDRTKDFIKSHLNDDPFSIALNKDKYISIDIDYAISDIAARLKLKTKMLEWADNFDLIMPKSVNIQQSSSDLTAKFKAEFCDGLKSIDLTGGFGIDSYFMSLNALQHHYVEPDKELFNIAKHNLSKLSADNLVFYNSTAQEFLNSNDSKFDLVYLDPSRRSAVGTRILKIQDYEPNLINILPTLKNISSKVLVKLSPMLDINEMIQLFPDVCDIYVVSVAGECKELLLYFNFGKDNHEKYIYATELSDKLYLLKFKNSNQNLIPLSDPKKYIYDFQPALLKSGFSDYYANSMGLHKIAKNTSLYTSDSLINDNSCKSFKVIKSIKPDAKQLTKLIPDMKSVVVRKNFPLPVEELRRKYKIAEGESKYIFAVRLMSGSTSFIVAEKI